jgi:hypothetical protein|tara:strand:+ start:1819 stop:3807 length:1989 start_codon:yes stop_codon:yes gene_type:complete
MATTRETYPIEFTGGLITNMSPLQQGINSPGSARALKNYEPSVQGGYRRIEGYTKYNSTLIPPYGQPVVHGGSQGTTTALVLGNIHKTPEVGDTLTIAGVSGTYTIASGGVTFDGTNNRCTLTLTTSKASQPANAAAVTFTSTTTDHLITGCNVFIDNVIVSRNADLFKVSSSAIVHANVPSYGTVLVNGGSESGAELAVDGLTAPPQVGDVFKIAGVDLIYTVTADASVSSGGSDLAVSPNLAASPADNAVVTFLSTARDGLVNKTRAARYNFSGTEKMVIVDGVNIPALYDGTTFTRLDEAPTDILGADFVTSFKNQLFFAINNVIVFSAPFTDNNFTAAAGAGTVSVGGTVTGLIVFREQLIIFTESSILQLTGNTIADFQLKPVTIDIGCIDSDTIQETGGDVMFLGPDGLRLLSATDRIGDFGLAVVSKTIQSEFTSFITSNTSFASIVIREKSQYRLLGFNTNITQNNAKGILGTQFAGQGGAQMAWAETRGIRAYVASSRFFQNVETIVFANDDGFVYKMESGNNFDGANIQSTFSTPYLPINDARIRKTFYKAILYTDPQGSVSFDLNLKLDFDQQNSIQPANIVFDNATTEVSFYGNVIYGGTATYGQKLLTLFETQLIGSGFVASLQFESDSTDPPFSLDAVTLEFGINTRR